MPTLESEKTNTQNNTHTSPNSYQLPTHELETTSKLISRQNLDHEFPTISGGHRRYIDGDMKGGNRNVVGLAQLRDWGHFVLGIQDCWSEFEVDGTGVNVAVLDTGIDGNHEDLKVTKGVDFTGSTYRWYDVQSHGTHCAGIIGARNDSTGVVGVAPNCNLYAVKVLGDNGSGSIEAIAAGIDWAVREKAHVISMSLGGDGPVHPLLKQAIDKAIASGCLIVCAAGNSGPYPETVGAPGKYTPCVTVGAINQQNNIANFSSRGVSVDVVAPGVDILSCVPGNRYSKMSGTSMATPYVSGIAALYVELMVRNGQTPSQSHFEGLLKSTAIDLGRVGHDADYGSGLVSPKKVLSSVLAQLPSKPSPRPEPIPNPPTDPSKPGEETGNTFFPTIEVDTGDKVYRFEKVRSFKVSY